MRHHIDRRTLLRSSGIGGLAVLLASCAGGDATPDAAPSGGTAPEGDGDGTDLVDNSDVVRGALDAAGVDAPLGLTPIIASFELLTTNGRVPFGLLDDAQEPLLDRELEVWLVDAGGELVAGPVTPLFYGEGLGTRGVYVAEVELPAPGLHDIVVVAPTDDGPRAGVAALQVVDPADSTYHPPGSTFPVVATPTVEAPGELEQLCTADPDCSMHGTDAAAVIGDGALVLSVATPAFCQTAVCGPVVDVIEQVRDALGRDDITWVHAEVYADAGVTPAPVIEELGLPSEPWTWVIDADGVVVDRFDGPVVPSLLRAAVERV